MDNALPQSVRPLVRKVVFQDLGGLPPPFLPFAGDGLVHPLDITVIYGKGGVGKGWVCCYIARALADEGIRPAVLDFEGHPSEWKQRTYDMGVVEGSIKYLDPSGPMTLGLARDLTDAVAEYDIGYFIVDSASAARLGVKENDIGGADAANALFHAIASIGVPTLVVAHESKGGKSGPIGSVQYSNVPRLVYRAEGDGFDTILHMDKCNDRPMEDKPLTFTRILLSDGGTDLVRRSGDIVKEAKQEKEAESTTAVLLRIMRDKDRSLAATEVQEFLEAEGHSVALDKVATIMRKLKMQGRLERYDRGRYAIPLPPEDKPPIM